MSAAAASTLRGETEQGRRDSQPPRVLRHLNGLRSWPAGVFALALAGAFVIYAQVWADPLHHAPGGRGHYNDPMQAMWNLKWFPWAVLHGHNPFATNAIYYPHGVSLSWNTLMPTLGIATAPVTLTLGAAVSFALLLVLGPATASLTGFLWLRRHTARPIAAAVGALVIGFNPFMTGHMQGQVNLTVTALIPVTLMLVEDLLWRRPRRNRVTAVQLGVVAAAQAGISEELLLITAIAAVVAVLWALLTRRAATVTALRRAVAPFGLAVAVFLLVASPLLVHQLFFSSDVGLRANHWRALIADYVAPLWGQAVTSRWPHLTYLGGAEDGVYFGLVLLAVLLAGLTLTLRRDRNVRTAAVVLAVMVVFTFGDAHPLGVALPWHWFGQLPVLRSVLPARFSFASWLAVAWLLAHWLDQLGAALTRPTTRHRAVVAVVAIAAGLITIVPRHVAASRLPDAPFFRSRGELAATLPRNSPVYLLPSPTFNDASGMYLQQLADFRFDQPGGYALRPDRGGAAYGPPASPLTTLAKLAGLSRPGTGAALPSDLLTQARNQLREEHYRAIVVVSAAPASPRLGELARELTGRGPDRTTGGVQIWLLRLR